ncbi:MAG: hypothetical protein LBC87_01735 [Fibromonadaceae bacterium]|jgi:hypothetical protein|nr:hypothetical protein [Fibromonadaceae bacterium]
MKKKIVVVAFAVALASTAFAYSKMKTSEEDNKTALEKLAEGIPLRKTLF